MLPEKATECHVMSRVDPAVVTVGLIIRVNEMKDPSMPPESQGSFNPEPTPVSLVALPCVLLLTESGPFLSAILARLIVSLLVDLLPSS